MKVKKNIYKNWWFCLMLVCLILGASACSSSTPPASQPAENASSQQSQNESTETKPSDSTTDWRKFLKDYEAFVDSYIVIIDKMRKNPTDASILLDYTNLSAKAAEWTTKYDTISAELSDPNELAEYAKEWTKIYTKLLNALA